MEQMAFFTPPTDNFVVYFGEDIGDNLFSRIPSGPRGRNVYLLKTGIYTEDQPPSLNDVEKTYYGGHSTEVTAVEVASLTAAGYGAYIS